MAVGTVDDSARGGYSEGLAVQEGEQFQLSKQCTLALAHDQDDHEHCIEQGVRPSTDYRPFAEGATRAMDAHQVLRRVDVQAKLLYVTLTNSIAPSIATAGGLEYGSDLLSAYSNAGKQLDALYAELDTTLSLCTPVPERGSAPAAIGAAKVSDLLCAAVAPNDAAALVLPELSSKSSGHDDGALLLQVQQHNALLEEVLANFSDNLESAKDRIREGGKRKRYSS